jgi:hypothetical protein
MRNALFPIGHFFPQRLHLRTELVDDCLQVFHRRNLSADRHWQFARNPVAGNTDRLIDAPQRVLNDRTAVTLAEQKADRRRVGRGPEEIVHRREVESSLPTPV